MKIFELHSKSPNKREIAKIVEYLADDGIMIFPTDTVLAIGCKMTSKKGIERILKVTNKEAKRTKLSLLCQDIKHAAQFLLPLPNHIFREIKGYVPGPYTFILKADAKKVKNLANKKHEVGIRIPDNEIVQDILNTLEEPIICTSLNLSNEGEVDFDIIRKNYEHLVDLIIQSEVDTQEVSTVFDCTEDELILVREGKGKV